VEQCNKRAWCTCGKSATPLATVEVVTKLPQFQSLVEICGIFATWQKKKTPRLLSESSLLLCKQLSRT
jgi:hypothetical protein